jgi:colicin import membrane protein
MAAAEAQFRKMQEESKKQQDAAAKKNAKLNEEMSKTAALAAAGGAASKAKYAAELEKLKAAEASAKREAGAKAKEEGAKLQAAKEKLAGSVQAEQEAMRKVEQALAEALALADKYKRLADMHKSGANATVAEYQRRLAEAEAKNAQLAGDLAAAKAARNAKKPAAPAAAADTEASDTKLAVAEAVGKVADAKDKAEAQVKELPPGLDPAQRTILEGLLTGNAAAAARAGQAAQTALMLTQAVQCTGIMHPTKAPPLKVGLAALRPALKKVMSAQAASATASQTLADMAATAGAEKMKELVAQAQAAADKLDGAEKDMGKAKSELIAGIAAVARAANDTAVSIPGDVPAGEREREREREGRGGGGVEGGRESGI